VKYWALAPALKVQSTEFVFVSVNQMYGVSSAAKALWFCPEEFPTCASTTTVPGGQGSPDSTTTLDSAIPSGNSTLAVFDPPSQDEIALTPAQTNPTTTASNIATAIRRRRNTSGDGLLDLGIWDMPSILGLGLAMEA
jgi:hypothetical protein